MADFACRIDKAVEGLEIHSRRIPRLVSQLVMEYPLSRRPATPCFLARRYSHLIRSATVSQLQPAAYLDVLHEKPP